MKIVSWNCLNGFNGEKPENIFTEFSKADIFVIQECKRNEIYDLNPEWVSKNWYGDDLDIKSKLGIAVFSKKHKIEFTCEFNRRFRYVVPYKIKINDKSLILLAIWTKSAKRGEFDYTENVIKAVEYYKSKGLFHDDVIMIGDFNTGYIEEYPERYTKLCEKLKTNGFIDCPRKNMEDLTKTFYYDKNGKEYLNDFCFVSEEFGKGKINLTTHNDWEKNKYGKKRWHGSDHCPISVKFDF
jgi:exonuclease III